MSERPSWRARRFIIRTKRAREPATPWARVAAASLALGSSSARMRSRTVMRSPGCSPIVTSAGLAR